MEDERGAYGRAGIFSRLTYGWVADFIAKGNEKPAVEGGDTLHEHDADYLLPKEFDTYSLRAKLHKHYRGSDEDDASATAGTASEGAGGRHHASTRNRRRSLLWALVKSHAKLFMVHALLVLGVTGMR